MDFDKDQPIYIQLIEDIKKDIINSKYSAGDKLPSIRDYAQDKMVNPNTAQKAYSELERLEYISSKRGIGYFVNEDQSKIDLLKYEFLDEEVKKFTDKLQEMKYTKEEILSKIRELLWLNLKMLVSIMVGYMP